jgi:hypothetical protein
MGMSGLKQIDEKEEEDDQENYKKYTNYIKKNILENIQTKKKYQSSKYLPILVLTNEENENSIHPRKETIKKEENIINEENMKKEDNTINEENNKKEDNTIKQEEKIKIEENIKKEENEILNNNNKIIEKKEDNSNSIITQRRKSIETENVIRSIKIDDEINKLIDEKIKVIDNLYYGIYSDDDSNFESTRSLPSISKRTSMEIPSDCQLTYSQIENKAGNYADQLNKYFYMEMFDNFFIKLKQLYQDKYDNYIKVNEEYHSSIKENEFILECNDNLGEIEKMQIQNIIDCLKEEQKDQIDKIVDEYNSKIKIFIDDFKQNLFKNNVGVQLMEEQLKLDIYTIINDAILKIL